MDEDEVLFEYFTWFKSFTLSAQAIYAQEGAEAAYEYMMATMTYGHCASEPSFNHSTLAPFMWIQTKPILASNHKKKIGGSAGGSKSKRCLQGSLQGTLQAIEQEEEQEIEKEICACGGRISYSKATGKRRCERCGEVY